METINNSTKKVAIENLDIQPASILKRFGATIIDLVILFIIYFLFGLVSRPILTAATNFNDLNAALKVEQKKSHLTKLDGVLLDDYSNIDEVDFVQNDNGTVYVDVEDYAEATYLFYTDYMARNYDGAEDKYSHEWYLNNILLINTESSLFEKISENEGEIDLTMFASDSSSEEPIVYDDFVPVGVKYKADVTPQEISEFNITIYSGAITELNRLDLVSDINMLLIMESMMLFVVSGSIVYLAVPLFLRNGQTLGKKILGIGVTDRYGYKLGTLSLVLRFFAFLVLYLLTLDINVLITFIIAFVSLTMTTFTKKMRSLHDFIASTRVVDLKKGIVYDNPEDYKLKHLEEFATVE